MSKDFKEKKNIVMTDKAKFSAACRKRGITAKDAALAIGMSSNYFSARLSEGHVPEYVAKLLKSELNMGKAEYEAEEPTQQATEIKAKETRIIAKIDMDELYECINSAVYAAVKRALSE